jgi:mono/diheme cytochrome c family protein
MNLNYKQIRSKTYAWLIATGVVFSMVACNSNSLSPGVEFMPDMYRGPASEPYSWNPFYADSLSSRKPVPGTISQGSMPNSPFSINNTVYSYPNTNEGYEAAGKYLHNPIAATAENLEKGKDLFSKFCMHCHGESGDGNGSMVANGKFPSPGAYWTKIGLNEGKMFHVMTYGKGLMGSHASQLNKEERWKLAMYVQSLIAKNGPKPETASADTSAKK